MPIRFTCPHCGATSEVPDEFSGQSGPCRQCGRTVTVPPAGGAAVYAAGPQRSAMPAWVIVLIVLVVLLVLGGLLVFIGIFVCGGIMTALMLPATQAAREAACRAKCLNNLSQIGLAMMQYEEEHGCFPPAYLADENGRPMHSWRVLILPYLEEEGLYRQYRFDEPWDSPHNRALTDLMPAVYRCPKDGDISSQETSYVVITGPEGEPGEPATVFSADQATTMANIRDGTSNTILLVETSGSGVDWMEPRDLDLEALDFTINSGSGQDLRSGYPGGVNAVLCDGSARFLPDSIDPETLRRLILRNAGLPVDLRGL